MKIVVLAAGQGTRMENKAIHKCLTPIKGQPFVTRMLEKVTAAIESKPSGFVSEIIFVVGHKHDMVNYEVSKWAKGQNLKVTFVYNSEYAYHGSGYSLSMIGPFLNERMGMGVEDMLILEADCMLPTQVYSDMIGNGVESRGLVGPNVNKFKSVVACTGRFEEEERITFYGYDRDHKDVFATVPQTHRILGESLQAWYICQDDFLTYVDLCQKLYDECNEDRHVGEQPNLTSNLEPTNRLMKTRPLGFAFYDGIFVNLNSQKDIDLAESLEWT